MLRFLEDILFGLGLLFTVFPLYFGIGFISGDTNISFIEAIKIEVTILIIELFVAYFIIELKRRG